jgi:hypothetical protein
MWRSVCQHRWKLVYLDKLRKDAYGIHMDFGTAVHGAIEKHKTRKGSVPLAEAVQLFEDRFRGLHKKNFDKYSDSNKKVDVEGMVLAGKRIIERLDDCQELASAEIVYNEYDLSGDIDRTDGLKIRFHGYIDLVIKTRSKQDKTILYVCDFKTCSWGWPREKRQDHELQQQLFLYKHFLCKKFDLDPTNVRCAFVLLKKRPAEGASPIEWFPVSAGPVSVQRALDALNSDLTEMAEREKTGNFVKNRESCVNDFGETCPFYNTQHCPGEK